METFDDVCGLRPRRFNEATGCESVSAHLCDRERLVQIYKLRQELTELQRETNRVGRRLTRQLLQFRVPGLGSITSGLEYFVRRGSSPLNNVGRRIVMISS